MSEDHPVQVPHRARRYAAIAGVVLAIFGSIALMMALPPDTYVLWFGETVDHCPDSDLSCPSHSLGLFHLILLPAVILLVLFEDDD